MVDTDGRPLGLLVHPADVQDRDGAVPLLKASRLRHPFVAQAFADSAYNSDRVANATSIDVQIVRRIADQSGFVVHPRRWVVERTFAWFGRNRLPLRRLRYAPNAAAGALKRSFDTDSSACIPLAYGIDVRG